MNLAATPSATRYVIVGCPRSGTTAVHIALKGHPQVSALNDEMRISPFFDQGLSIFTFGHEPENEKRVAHRALFDAITDADAKPDVRARGLKVCAQNVHQARSLVDGLRADFPDVKVVLVDREDLVAQYGSLRTAQQSGIWHSWYARANERTEARRVRINALMFKSYALECLDTLAVLRELERSHAVFVCKHADVVADEARVYAALFRFVGLAPADITWFRAKKLLPPARDYIANYDELTAALARLRALHADGAVPSSLRFAVHGKSLALMLWNLVARHGDTGPG